jgi:hypothetical protein
MRQKDPIEEGHELRSFRSISCAAPRKRRQYPVINADDPCRGKSRLWRFEILPVSVSLWGCTLQANQCIYPISADPVSRMNSPRCMALKIANLELRMASAVRTARSNEVHPDRSFLPANRMD